MEIDALIQKGSGKIAVGFGGNPKDKSAVRGGPGFELMFNIHNLLKKKKAERKIRADFFCSHGRAGRQNGTRCVAHAQQII